MKVVDDCNLKNNYKYCKYRKILDLVEKINFLIAENDKKYTLVSMSSILEDMGIFDDHDKENAYNGIRYHLFYANIFVSKEIQKENNTMILKIRKRCEKDNLPEFLSRLPIPPPIKYNYEIMVKEPTYASYIENSTINDIKLDEPRLPRQIINPIAQPISENILRKLDESIFPPIWNPSPGDVIYGLVTSVFYDPKGNEGNGRVNITIDTRNQSIGKLGIWGSEVIYRRLADNYGIERTEIEKLKGKYMSIRYNGEKISNSSGHIYKDYDLVVVNDKII